MSDLGKPTYSSSEWIERFEAELKRRFHDRSTAKHYVSDLRLFVAFHPGPLESVSGSDIAQFVDEERRQGKSESTVKRRVSALKTFYDFLGEALEDPKRANPVSLRRHAGRQPTLLPRDLNDDEVERLLASVGLDRDRAMVNLMLFGGLRVGEVASLKRGDIDVPLDGVSPIRLRVLGKGRKERVAYLTREAYAPLSRYLQEQGWAGPSPEGGEPVFRTRLGGGFSVVGIQDRVAHYATTSGVEVTCHRLRHTYGRWMAEREMPVLTLSRLLGHVSIATTQRYIDGANPEVRRGYEAAMAKRGAASDESVVPSQSAAELRPDAVVSVVRQQAPVIDGSNWLPQGPEWLRVGVQAWLHHQWGTWKVSQRCHHAGVRLRQLRQFWEWQLAHRDLQGWEDLGTADIAAYTDAELQRGLQAKTVKTALDRAYEVLRYLQGEGRLTKVPDRPKLRLPNPLPRHLGPREVLGLEAEIARRESATPVSDSDRLDLALYYLLGHAGLRISEVLDLKVEDLDLLGRRIRVREGKGRRDRVVYLTAKATAELGEYLQTVPHAPGDLVISYQGKALDYDAAWQRVSCLGQTAGVKGLCPHRLRHTYATHLLNNGLSIEALRRLMGHENLNTTLIYARLADTTLERQYRAAMEPAPPGAYEANQATPVNYM